MNSPEDFELWIEAEVVQEITDFCNVDLARATLEPVFQNVLDTGVPEHWVLVDREPGQDTK